MSKDKYPSLSGFLNSTKKIEEDALGKAIDSGPDQVIQKILNESAVSLSVYNQVNKDNANPEDKAKAAKLAEEFIQQGIKESVEVNSSRVKSILEDIFTDYEFNKERENFWINKLCDLFNISKDASIEEKSALIEKQLGEDEDTLNYVMYLVEADEKRGKK